MKYGAPLPWRAMRWLICERLHWTLEEVDRVPWTDLQDGFEVWHGLSVAREG